MTSPTIAELREIREAFEQRRDAAFEEARGQPLEKEDIEDRWEDRGLFARKYSMSIIDFAFAAMWNDEQLDTANDALIENAEFYLDHRGARNDRDSLYWPADRLCRILEFFGRDGSKKPGRLTEEAEDTIHEMMWTYVEENSTVDSLEEVNEVYDEWRWDDLKDRGFPPLPQSASLETDTWDVIESENHHAQKFTALWHFSKLLKEVPEYADRSYADGHTAAAHEEAWTEYVKEYVRQRAKKGLLIEMANGHYGSDLLKGLYNFYDFAEDPRLRELVGNFFDLYYTSWAQEQLDGVRSGGKSRVYTSWHQSGSDTVRDWMWFYLGIGSQQDIEGSSATVATSEYRLPIPVMDIALDVEGRGEFELRERRPGLAREGFHTNPQYGLRQEFGGILRYTYTTPDFIMGMPLLEPRPKEDWALISSQNRRHCVIFPDHPDARIAPFAGTETGFNTQWGVQQKGAMITQRLPDSYSENAGGLRVWFSDPGLYSPYTERDGWTFAETDSAYAAVGPARGGYTWEESEESVAGDWMVLDDADAPVIIQVARGREFADFEAFQEAVLDRPIERDREGVTYTSLSEDVLSLRTVDGEDDHLETAPPRVNGEPVNLEPEQVFDSPFIQSEWDSGVVSVTKDDRTLELDFR